jgi:hypothetical protein
MVFLQRVRVRKLTIGLLVILFFLPCFQAWGRGSDGVFTAGLRTNIEVTNAQTSVARARDNQIEALFRFNASRINLARAKGEIEKLF